MFVKSLFKLMSVHRPQTCFHRRLAVQIKIKGDVVPVDANTLDVATMKRIAYEAMTRTRSPISRKKWRSTSRWSSPASAAFA